MSRRSWLVGTAFAGLLALGGCGGGDAGTTVSTTTALTKQQFKSKAHQLCYRLSKKQSRQIEAFYERHGWNPRYLTERQMERMNAAVVFPIVEEKIGQLGALPPPKGDEHAVDKILASMKAALRESHFHPQWLVDQTPTRPSLFVNVEKLTAAYGIWFCGEP